MTTRNLTSNAPIFSFVVMNLCSWYMPNTNQEVASHLKQPGDLL